MPVTPATLKAASDALVSELTLLISENFDLINEAELSAVNASITSLKPVAAAVDAMVART